MARHHRLPALGAVVVVLAATLAGCGGGGGSSNNQATSTSTSAPSSGSAITTVTVHETEYKLNPSTISLDKPGTYVFKGVNDGTVDHALAVEGHGIDKDGSAISPGSSRTLKVALSKAGTYEIYCPIDGHKQQGMEGKITVGSGGSGGTSTEDNTHTGSTETGGGGGRGNGY
jgi:plastocyanin